MLTLIKKELMLYRISLMLLLTFSILTAPITIIFISIMTDDSILGISTQVFSLFMGFLITTAIAIEKEKKVGGHMIYYSLPIEKDLLITAKYLSVALIPLGQSLINLASSYIFKWTKGFKFLGTVSYGFEIKAINVFNMLLALSINLLFLSVFLYVYYRNIDKAKKQNKFWDLIKSLLYIGIFTGLRLILEKYWKVLGRFTFNELGKNSIILLLFLVSILSYYSSMELTKRRVR